MENEEYLKKGNKDNLNRSEKELSEIERIISEYEERNSIECITEEELTDLFGDSILTLSQYYPYGEGPYVEIDCYDDYLLKHGINPFEGWEYKVIQEYLDEIKQTDDGIDLADCDCIQSYEVSMELYWCPCHLSFNESLQVATILDRMYFEMENNDIITGIGFFEKGETLREYFAIEELEYDYMKVDEPDWLSEGELECSLADDLDYLLSIRTKTIDLYVADLTELNELFEEPIHETIIRQIIHMEVNAKRFLIVVDIDDQYIIYSVFHQPDSNSYENLTELGWDIYHESALRIIDYYLETGLTLTYYQ